MFLQYSIKNLFVKQFNKNLFVKQFTTINKIDELLINKSLYNLNLLRYHNKNGYIIFQLESDLQKKKNNPDCNIDLNYINDYITTIFLSYSIKEALDILRDNDIYKDKINYYELQYQYKCSNNINLDLLFKEIEDDIKQIYKNRLVFNILPFYYNIYLNQMK